jgi:hypothetical protein
MKYQVPMLVQIIAAQASTEVQHIDVVGPNNPGLVA